MMEVTEELEQVQLDTGDRFTQCQSEELNKSRQVAKRKKTSIAYPNVTRSQANLSAW